MTRQTRTDHAPSATTVTSRAAATLRRHAASIRTRLVVGVLAVLVVALGGTAIGTRVVLQAGVDARIDDQLRQEVEELRLFSEQGLDPRTGAPFGTATRRLLTVFVARNVPTDGEVIVGYVGGEPVVRTFQATPYRVDVDGALSTRWATVDEPTRADVPTPAGRFEYLAVPVRSEDAQDGVLLVGIFRDVVAAEVDQTVAVTALIAPLALLIGLATAAGLARRILQPLASMSEQAAALGDSDLSRRLGAAAGHDEVGQLAGAFNGMLDRLESAFGEQRDFLDDAGHELRTPITVVRGHLELLDEGASVQERAATRSLVIDELDRMRRIVDDLLMLAQRDRPDFVVPADLELDELTTSVLRRATALSDEHAWRLDAVGVGVVQGDVQRLAQALLQLAHNAAHHTPPGTTVRLGSAIEPGVARLWVADDGPGVPEQDRERVFRRFDRGAGQRRRSEGAGLGLAIVAAVAHAHGGRVELRAADGGGAHFELLVPQPRPGPVHDDPGDDASAGAAMGVPAPPLHTGTTETGTTETGTTNTGDPDIGAAEPDDGRSTDAAGASRAATDDDDSQRSTPWPAS